jgi:hypothetical protein
MIYEIRNYHFEPTLLGEYEEWVTKHAMPYMREHLDLVGFWMNVDEPAQVTGKPLDELGSATVTWIIRWDDLETRNRVMSEVFASSEEWAEITKAHPGREHYHRIEARFAKAL